MSNICRGYRTAWSSKVFLSRREPTCPAETQCWTLNVQWVGNCWMRICRCVFCIQYKRTGMICAHCAEYDTLYNVPFVVSDQFKVKNKVFVCRSCYKWFMYVIAASGVWLENHVSLLSKANRHRKAVEGGIPSENLALHCLACNRQYLPSRCTKRGEQRLFYRVPSSQTLKICLPQSH